eukprot:CAMPEP_0116092882 /NCGR_PEP_ID=MMETSP0327-20121206/8282_1 /TAXON_ID=44447 /ORGANISM="Pseudo-nitzschia delicatissima, Strain B596" /LENGTH=789 /DNA_ID=CAMNT_0003584343 /DNA_START=223 /DNA_END=2592 /DNA_ORIENTATION=-
MSSSMEILKDDSGPCQIPLVAIETAAVIASKLSTAPLPSAPSFTNIQIPPHGTGQFDPRGKKNLALYPNDSLSSGMPQKLRSFPTQQTTKQQTSPASNSLNRNRDMVLRSGKWNPEEELYANILIELFEEGRVDEFEKNLDGNNDQSTTGSNEKDFKVTNGMTLRAYLSRKLYCSPMRISKKFAGRGIGKLVYMSQRSGSYHGFRQRFQYGAGRMYNNRLFSHPSDIHWTKVNRLKEAESNFLRLAFRNGRPQQKLKKRKNGSQNSPIDSEEFALTQTSPEKVPRITSNNHLDVGSVQSCCDEKQLVHHQHGRDQHCRSIRKSPTRTKTSEAPFPCQSPTQYATSNAYSPIAPFVNNSLQLQQEQPSNNFVQIQDHAKAADTARSNYRAAIIASPNALSQQQPSPLMAAPTLLSPNSKKQQAQEQRQSQIQVLKEAYFSSVSPQKSQVPENMKRNNVPTHFVHNDRMGNDSGLHHERYADPMQMPRIDPSINGVESGRMTTSQKCNDTGKNSIESQFKPGKDNTVGNSQTSTKPESGFDWSQTMSPPKPDFLSGFDKVSKPQLRTTFDENIKNDTVCDLQQIAEISPAYHTSKSFDDFHRYLGKGLSPKILPPLKFPSLRTTTTAGPSVPPIRSPSDASISKLHLRPRNPKMMAPPTNDNTHKLCSKSLSPIKEKTDDNLGKAYAEAMGHSKGASQIQPTQANSSDRCNAFPGNPTLHQQSVYTAQEMHQEPSTSDIQKPDESSDFPIEGMMFEDFDTLASYTDARTNSCAFSSDRCAIVSDQAEEVPN